MLLSLNTKDAYLPLIERRRVTKFVSLLYLFGLLALGLWFYQLSKMWFWQQDLQQKLEQVKPPQTIVAADPQQPLLVSNVTLPNLPSLHSSSTLDHSSASLPNRDEAQPASINTPATLATLATTPSRQQAQVLLETQTFSKPEEIKAIRKAKPVQNILKKKPTENPGTRTKHKKEVKSRVDSQAVMQQLQFSSGLDLQIALPQNAAKRERLIGYLYRCSGAQFAVLQQQQLIYLSPKRYVPTSKWLRVVSGGLSSQERAWLGNHRGQPVRLLPQAVDQLLANYIAKALQGKPLHSLRAQYILTPSGLALSHIKLNQQLIATQWPLHQSQCR